MSTRTSLPRQLLSLLADIISVTGTRYALYVALLLLTGLMEGLSLASAVPLLWAIGIGSAGAGPAGKLDGLALSVLSWAGMRPTMVSIAIVVLFALMASTVLFLAQAYASASLQTLYVYRWQQRLASVMFGARWNYFHTHRNGDLINAIVTETQRLGGAFYQTGLLLTGIVYALVFLLIAAALSGLTVLLVLAGGAILFLVTRPLIHRASRAGTGISKENAALQSQTVELISGAKMVKATATEIDAVRLLTSTASRLRQHFLVNAFDVQVTKAVFDFGAVVIVAGILIVSRAISGSDPAVTLVVLAIFVRLLPRLTGVQFSLQSLSLSLPAFELVQTMATEAESEVEFSSAEPLPPNLAAGPLALSLHDVQVKYGLVPALRGVDLSVRAGSCVALVGGSGAGKSTLVDAVLGLVPTSSGQITINGVLLEKLPLAALRRRIGYVGQDTALYNTTIRENILWGRRAPIDEELAESARLAGADRFIEKLRDGYETPVGDAGALLSGGERQRVGLARAALGAPGLLILDEATSALDAQTERAVTDAVAALNGKTTVIMTAHRLSSARIANVICVMEEGRVVEQGSWEELMRRGGRFYELWRLQNTKEWGSNVEA